MIGQVREEPPRLAFVVGLVEAAVVAEQHVIPVRRIEVDDVMVDVHAGAFEVGVVFQFWPPSVLRSTLMFTDQIVSAR